MIKIKANRPAKMGPVVKLMQLLIDKGMNEIAAYYNVFEKRFKVDLKNTNRITLGSYYLKSKLSFLTILPKL